MGNLQPLDLSFATAQEKNKKMHTIIVHLDDFDAIVGKIVMIASSPFINSAAQKRNSGRFPIKANKLK